MNKSKILLALLLCVSLVSVLSAQSTQATGSIRGTVKDADGAPLPGVTVTAAGPKQMGTPSVVTGSDGVYRLIRLTPGTIRVTAALDGFNTSVQESLRITAGLNVTINFTLAQSSLTEEVTVTAAAPVVDVLSNKLSNTVKQESIVKLPLQRHISAILNMMPGIEAGQGWDERYGGDSRVAGGLQTSLTWQVEGMSVNAPSNNSNNIIALNFDAMEEVEVVTGAAPADSSATSGAYVNIITKSGSNDFHGHITGYYTNDKMYKSLWYPQYTELIGSAVPNRPKYETQASASLGGPIFKDKLWFFSNFGLFDTERGGIFVPVTILGTSYENYSDTQTDLDGFLKLTSQLSPAMKLFAQLTIKNTNRNDHGGGNRGTIESAYNTTNKRGLFGSANLSWTLGQNSIIDFRVGIVDATNPVLMQDGTDGNITYSDNRIPGATGTYTWNAPGRYNQTAKQNSKQFSAKLTHYLDGFLGADHEFGMGVEFDSSFDRFSWYRDNPLVHPWRNENPYYYREQFNLDTPHPTFGDGYIAGWYAGPTADNSLSQANQKRFGAYIQDSITIGQRLTINVGLRYDHRNGYLPAATKAATTGILNGIGAAVIEPDFGFNPFGQMEYPGYDDALVWDVLAPRIGLSYDLFGDGKTAIKASWARYGDVLLIGTIAGLHPFRARNFTFYWWDDNANMQLDPAGEDTYTFRSGSAAGFDTNLLESKVDPGTSSSYWNEFIAGINHELFPHTNVGVKFTYKSRENMMNDVRYDTATDRLWYTYEQAPDWYVPFNVAYPGGGVESYPASDFTMYFMSNDAPWRTIFYKLQNVPEATWKYRSLEFTWDKRHVNGWSFGGSAVFSKGYGNTSPWLGWGSPGFGPEFNDANYLVNLPNDSISSVDRPLMIKLYGAFDMPLGFLASFSWRGWSGNVSQATARVFAPSDWVAANNVRNQGINVRVYPGNSEELAARRGFQNWLDVRMEKEFKVFSGRLGFFFDVFNILGYRWPQIGDNPGGTYRPAAEGTSVGGVYTPGTGFGNVWRLRGSRDLRLSVRYTF